MKDFNCIDLKGAAVRPSQALFSVCLSSISNAVHLNASGKTQAMIAEEEHRAASFAYSTQGQALNGKVQTEEEKTTDQGRPDQSLQQVVILPSDVLIHVLSYTGTQAAVLAAGPAVMRSWSAVNIANWLLQHFAENAIAGEAAAPVRALLKAIQHQLDEPAKVLVTQSEGPDSSQAWNDVMEAAARHGCVCIVNMMLDWMSDNTFDDDKAHETCRRVMKTACQYGQLQLVKLLLDEARPFACRPNEQHHLWLMTAAQYGHVDIIKELLNPLRKHCARANANDSLAVYTAAREGHVNVMLELLDTSRENHACANDNNCSALFTAAHFGHLNCVRVLLDTSRPSCALANASNSFALRLAAGAGHLHVVEELLNTSRPNHATADAEGSAALLSAAKDGHSDIVRTLLWQEHHPAEPQSANGIKALKEVVRQGNLECCKLLLGYPGLPPMDMDKSLLKAAASSNNWEVAALLKEAAKRYESVSGSWMVLRRISWILSLWKVVLLLLTWFLDGKVPSLFETVKSPVWLMYASLLQGYLCGVWFLARLLAQVYCQCYGAKNKRTAEQKAAEQNAEYRALWYKAHQKSMQ